MTRATIWLTTRVGTARGGDTFNVRRSEAFGGGALLLRKAYVALDGPIANAVALCIVEMAAKPKRKKKA